VATFAESGGEKSVAKAERGHTSMVSGEFDGSCKEWMLIERLLLNAPKKEEQMSNKDRGLLIVGVSSMRTWAAGLGGSNREGLLDDLRLVEEPGLGRVDKLRVIERIWRCWGTDGKRRV
jgi:hypothetical protein